MLCLWSVMAMVQCAIMESSCISGLLIAAPVHMKGPKKRCMCSTVDECSVHVNLASKGLKFLDERAPYIHGGKMVIPRDSRKLNKATSPQNKTKPQTKNPTNQINKPNQTKPEKPQKVVIEVAFMVQGMLVKMYLNLTRIFTWLY